MAKTECADEGKKFTCTHTPGIPASTYGKDIDRNENDRDRHIVACMYSRKNICKSLGGTPELCLMSFPGGRYYLPDDWENVGTVDKAIYYAAPSTIKRSGDISTLAALLEFQDLLQVGKSDPSVSDAPKRFKSVVMSMTFRCTERQYMYQAGFVTMES